MAHKSHKFHENQTRMELFINNNNIDKVGMMMALKIGSSY